MDARIRNLMGITPKLKQASLLWLEGFREACCLHRVIIYCLRSKELAIRTGQCFLLNGLIFLGSIFVLKSFVIPTIEWLLPDGCPHIYLEEPCWGIFRFYSYLRLGLIQLFYVFWFYPMYMFSFILSTIWYNDIAKYGFFAIEKCRTSGSRSSGQKDTHDGLTKTDSDKATDIEGVMIGIAEQIYSVLLLSFFFLQVYVTGFVPYIGKALNFLLLSWMYAYYCFEYKWNYSALSVDKRLDFFESNWPFFTGFGSPCVLAVFFYSPLVSYGVMAILYPLARKQTKSLLLKERNGKAQDWEGFRYLFLLITCRHLTFSTPLETDIFGQIPVFIHVLVLSVESVVSHPYRASSAENARSVNTPMIGYIRLFHMARLVCFMLKVSIMVQDSL